MKMLSITTLLLLTQLHHALSSPPRSKRSPLDLQQSHLLIPTHTVVQNNVPLLQQNGHSLSVIPHNSHTVQVLPQNLVHYQRKGLLAPIPLSQYVPKLQYVPQSNVIHNTIQHVHNKEQVKIPVYQTVPHSGGNVHASHLVPVHDLSVIPLGRANIEPRASHYRSRERDEEESIQYRNFYGGFGTGLFFGGHGSGHGFYAYG